MCASLHIKGLSLHSKTRQRHVDNGHGKMWKMERERRQIAKAKRRGRAAASKRPYLLMAADPYLTARRQQRGGGMCHLIQGERPQHARRSNKIPSPHSPPGLTYCHNTLSAASVCVCGGLGRAFNSRCRPLKCSRDVCGCTCVHTGYVFSYGETHLYSTHGTHNTHTMKLLKYKRHNKARKSDPKVIGGKKLYVTMRELH